MVEDVHVAVAVAVVENGLDHMDQAAKKARDVERRRRRRKQKKKSRTKADSSADPDSDKEDEEKEELEQVEIEYVSEKPKFADSNGHLDPLIEDFVRVFEKFTNAEELFPVFTKDDGVKEDNAPKEVPKKKLDSDDSSEDEDDTIKGKDKGISNKKKKLQRRMKIAELKQQCLKPDVVEVWDATASDPRLLVFLKGYRNTVPVPRHWCQKRKFLQGMVHRSK